MIVFSDFTTNSYYFPPLSRVKELGSRFADQAFSFNHSYDDYQPVQLGNTHIYVPITQSDKTASLLAKTALVLSTIAFMCCLVL